MRAILLAGAALCCIQIALAPVARAADREFCERYARHAREQTERAREGRCWRTFDMRNARWESSYEDHFRWCRRADFREVERESEIRQHELRRCGM